MRKGTARIRHEIYKASSQLRLLTSGRSYRLSAAWIHLVMDQAEFRRFFSRPGIGPLAVMACAMSTAGFDHRGSDLARQ
jgi:hypothetical protein